MTSGLKKQNNITSFFKPTTKQTSIKRTFPVESLTADTQRRVKDPRREDERPSLPQAEFSSSKGTHAQSLQNVSSSQKTTELSSEPSSVPTLSQSSGDSDIIVVQVPPKVHKDTRSTTRDPPVSQSFTGSVSSSHRIERYGETIVTGSDDDSDDFLDLDGLLGRKPVKPTPIPHIDQGDSQQGTSRGKSKHIHLDTSKDDQIRFNSLLEKAKKDQAKSVSQKKALEQSKEFGRNASGIPSKQETSKAILTAEAIVTRVGDLDAEKVEKFAQAIERTELTQGTQTWSFFDSSLDSKVGSQHGSGSLGSSVVDLSMISSKSTRRRLNRRWPDLQQYPEWSVYKDSLQRELAFISGVFEQAVAAHQLPEEILVWILNQSFIEPQVDLRNAYCLVLRYANTYISSDQILKHAELVLQGLGATNEAMSVPSNQIRAKTMDHVRAKVNSLPRESLCIWLRNTTMLMKSMSNQDRARILDLLFTLTLDTAVPDDILILIDLQASLEECIQHLEQSAEGSTMLDQSLRRIYNKAGNVHFRLQFLKCMPVTTYTVARIRKRFASASLYNDHVKLEAPSDPNYLQHIGALLKSNEKFQLRSRTDYHDLAAYIACFDVAVGAGENDELITPTSIQRFNTVIDELTDIVRNKYARTQTTGAVHMSRTEVKDALTTIEKRLSFAVRTERKRHPNVFNQLTLDKTLRK